MFKKKVNFEEFIDLFTEAILYKLPIKVDPIDIIIEEAKEISNHISIFQLLILSDYLLSIIDFKNDANYLRNYIWYKIEGKIKELKDKDLIVSTKIDNVYSAFIIGIGNNALYTISEKYKEDKYSCF